MSANIKFSNNSAGASATVQVTADGQANQLDTLLVGSNSVSGNQINQIEVLDGGNGIQLTVQQPGQADKTATAPGFGDNIINFQSPTDVGQFTIILTKT